MSILLGRPLTFGDPEQIAAIKKEQEEITEQEELSGIKIEGKTKNYNVKIYFNAYSIIKIKAINKEQAVEIAEKLVDEECPDFCEFKDAVAWER